LSDDAREYDEPVIVFTVRSLLKAQRDEINATLKEISAKLDDRVTLAVFRAMRSDLDAAVNRLVQLETKVTEGKAEGRGAWWMLVRIVIVLWALASSALSVYLGVR
jgi:hypothetical protein